MANYWFTSDTHFGHANIIKYTERKPWYHPEDFDENGKWISSKVKMRRANEMDVDLIANWNRVVKPSDQVFHLGDFAFVKDAYEGEKIVRRLNGQITLIKGNHDRTNMIKRMGFAATHKLLEWRAPTNPPHLITMCHHPMLMWRDSHLMQWHFHGHTHGLLPESNDRLSIDVGVDCWNYTPVSLEVLVERFRIKEENWRALIMSNNQPFGAGADGFYLYALCTPTNERGFQQWLKDCGDHWEDKNGYSYPKNENDRVRYWCWAVGFDDIMNRSSKGG